MAEDSIEHKYYCTECGKEVSTGELWWEHKCGEFRQVQREKKLVYIAGSMRNRAGVIEVALRLQARGFRIFCDWLAPGEQTDEKWQEFAQALGQKFIDAIHEPHAKDVFEFDKKWLDKADALLVVGAPGKSAMAELGYMRGQGKLALVYLTEEPERWDVMMQFATEIYDNLDDVLAWLENGL